MTITIDIQPEIELSLLSRAEAQGISIAEYVRDIVARDALAAVPEETHAPETPAKDMVELFAPLRGLNIDFERDRDPGRDILL